MIRFDPDRFIVGWRAPALAALVALLAALPGALAVPPLDRDESRFAQASAQMLQSGDFVNIRFQDEPRHKKPVGIYWMQAAATGAFSSAEARAIVSYRIPSLLGAMLAAAACAWGAATFFGSRAGFLAGATLGSSFLLSSEGFIAKTDAMNAGLIALAMTCLARIYAAHRGGPPLPGRWVEPLMWTALAAAVLVKGPVAPIVFGLTLLALWAWDRDRGWISGLRWDRGLLIGALVIGPWAAAVTVATDGAFWASAVGGDMVPKLAGGQETHGAPPGYHLLLLPVLFFPGTLLLGAAAHAAWTRRDEPAIRFAIAWLVPTVLFWEMTPTKLAHYTLPAYAALAWLVAAGVSRPVPDRARKAGAALALAAALAITALCVRLLAEFGGSASQPWVSTTAVLALATVLVGGFFLLNRASMTALTAACALGVASHAALAAGLLPRLESLWLSPKIVAALDAAHLNPRGGLAPGPVAIVGYAEPSAVFLLGGQVELLAEGADAAPAIAGGRAAVVEIAREPEFLAALAERGVRAREVSTVEGVNYSNGRRMRMVVYAPERSSR